MTPLHTRRRQVSLLIITTGLATAACRPSTRPSALQGQRCGVVGRAAIVSEISDERIDELSGLVVSHTYPGVGWVHNDSGADAVVYALDLATGATIASYTLAGVEAIDWEDIALAPADDGSGWDLYVADTGDNFQRRPFAVIYRIKEPAPSAGDHVIQEVERMEVTYPSGPTNAECLAVDGDGALVIVTKPDGPTGEWMEVGAFIADGTVTATPRGTIDLNASTSGRENRSTGCDYEASTGRFVLRTYAHAFLVDGGPGATLDQLTRAPSCVLELPPQEQGEAVAFDAHRPGVLLLASEETHQPLWAWTLEAGTPP